ncbi:hypothetical protein GCM10027589_44810 [Actinocorallia lasiicapitis]
MESPVTHGSDVGLVERIEAEFPGWGVWRSDADRWWAYRKAHSALTLEQLRAGCRLIVQADTGDQLRAAIRHEIDRAARYPR